MSMNHIAEQPICCLDLLNLNTDFSFETKTNRNGTSTPYFKEIPARVSVMRTSWTINPAERSSSRDDLVTSIDGRDIQQRIQRLDGMEFQETYRKDAESAQGGLTGQQRDRMTSLCVRKIEMGWSRAAQKLPIHSLFYNFSFFLYIQSTTRVNNSSFTVSNS